MMAQSFQDIIHWQPPMPPTGDVNEAAPGAGRSTPVSFTSRTDESLFTAVTIGIVEGELKYPVAYEQYFRLDHKHSPS